MRPCGTYESEWDFAPKHFNPVPSFPGYKIAQGLIFFDALFSFSVFVYIFFGFFTISSVKHYTYIRC